MFIHSLLIFKTVKIHKLVTNKLNGKGEVVSYSVSRIKRNFHSFYTSAVG
jgi:hypothetical protein